MEHTTDLSDESESLMKRKKAIARLQILISHLKEKDPQKKLTLSKYHQNCFQQIEIFGDTNTKLFFSEKQDIIQYEKQSSIYHIMGDIKTLMPKVDICKLNPNNAEYSAFCLKNDDYKNLFDIIKEESLSTEDILNFNMADRIPIYDLAISYDTNKKSVDLNKLLKNIENNTSSVPGFPGINDCIKKGLLNCLNHDIAFRGNTYLIWWIVNDYTKDALKILNKLNDKDLLKYISLEKQERNKRTPLLLAIAKKYMNTETKKTYNKETHFDLYNEHDSNLINFLINNVSKESLITPDNNGNTPLHVAILKRDKVTIKLLINKAKEHEILKDILSKTNGDNETPSDMINKNYDDSLKIINDIYNNPNPMMIKSEWNDIQLKNKCNELLSKEECTKVEEEKILTKQNLLHKKHNITENCISDKDIKFEKLENEEKANFQEYKMIDCIKNNQIEIMRINCENYDQKNTTTKLSK